MILHLIWSLCQKWLYDSSFNWELLPVRSKESTPIQGIQFQLKARQMFRLLKQVEFEIFSTMRFWS